MKKYIFVLIVLFLAGFVYADEKFSIANSHQLKQGKYTSYSGYSFEFSEHNGTYTFDDGNIPLNTRLKINAEENEQGKVKLKILFNNGDSYELKIMPDSALKIGLASLKIHECREENECRIELKDIGEKNKTQVVYEITANKNSRLFFIFAKNMRVKSLVDIENGEVLYKEKPFWGFFANE